jgi:hypothetical protein
MSCLTESSVIFNVYEPENPKKNDWFGVVYLCIKKKIQVDK